MRINEILQDFAIFTTREEEQVLSKLKSLTYLKSFSEREQVVIEGMIRKSLVIKVGNTNPKVIANEF